MLDSLPRDSTVFNLHSKSEFCAKLVMLTICNDTCRHRPGIC